LEKRNTGDKYPWYKVEKNGRTGWVYGRYVSEK
ncbi:MAG: SH3 domain-containing protein, partial [Pyramidobacter sp.]|nr:SH3 domain-containing protein [Pyramidobacter sp.]